MASGEKPSWGGNLLEKLKRSPLARAAGALAIVASAVVPAAGCEGTAAGSGSDGSVSQSVNNVMNNRRLVVRMMAGSETAPLMKMEWGVAV